MQDRNYLTISELVLSLNQALEESFPAIYFQGEISQISQPSSGHIYFTLKDDQSQIACAMWRSAVSSLKFTPEAGMAVLCQGRPNIYNKSGRFQIVVGAMWQAGAGLLQQRFLELKAKLEKEGLFNPERKRSLPFFPRAVGVITSKTGAVIHDIMIKVKERFAAIPIYLIDVRVQGTGAAEEIAAALEQLSNSGLVDVIIVGRGGGSLEDLWAFNEEIVVRAIFAAKVPVISAVGHESDISLADLTADMRAPTPTAAAEMVVPKRTDLLDKVVVLEKRLFDLDRWFSPLTQTLDETSLRLGRAMFGVQSTMQLKVHTAEARLSLLEPSRIITVLRGRIELIASNLSSNGQQNLNRARNSLDVIRQRLHTALSIDRLKLWRRNVNEQANRLDRAQPIFVATKKHSLEQLANRLEAISPIKVLKRGYAVVESQGELIRTNAQLHQGTEIKVSFMEDAVIARVEKNADVNWRTKDGK